MIRDISTKNMVQGVATGVFALTMLGIGIWVLLKPSSEAVERAADWEKHSGMWREINGLMHSSDLTEALEGRRTVHTWDEWHELAITHLEEQSQEYASDSPMSLLSSEEAARMRGTKQNLQQWFSTVDGFEDVRWEDVEYNEELDTLWQICREGRALNVFIDQHIARSLERWVALRPPVSLVQELGPVRDGFMQRHTNSQEVWDALDAFSVDALAHVHSEGFRSFDRGSVESWSDLHEALKNASSPSWDAVVEILRKETH